MANPFANWTPQMVAERNTQVTKATMSVLRERQVICGRSPEQPQIQSHRVLQFAIDHEPVPAPRMTQKDRWAKRPCVERYFDYRNLVKELVGELDSVPDELHCKFFFTMPESWSKKRRAAAIGTPHRQRPDFDNLVKAVSDALFEEDGGVWKSSQEKRWAVKGRVELTLVWNL